MIKQLICVCVDLCLFSQTYFFLYFLYPVFNAFIYSIIFGVVNRMLICLQELFIHLFIGLCDIVSFGPRPHQPLNIKTGFVCYLPLKLLLREEIVPSCIHALDELIGVFIHVPASCTLLWQSELLIKFDPLDSTPGPRCLACVGAPGPKHPRNLCLWLSINLSHYYCCQTPYGHGKQQ